MTDAIEQPPVKKGLSGTALRVVTVLPLIPIILWMMFAGPRLLWQGFILTAIAIGGYELMAMKVPSSRGLRAWGSVTSALFGYTVLFVNDADKLYAVILIIIVGSMAWSLLQEDPLHNASVRIGWLLGTPIYVGGTLVLLIFGVMLTAQAAFVSMKTRRDTGGSIDEDRLQLATQVEDADQAIRTR